ncbi:hypothetical protein [Chitinimonas sp. BJB300]|uniref:hypothetical protein n=1 Tax=Chitinimonas sp. BJB300 TaxID=1559339 RepID=UPI000C0D3393|nr:hypothetical protein [Chitinimonas sp. BJB300]PHV12950.1 hypothetical protein CSQ89_02965 [Chitinimonas sp. BJB300]TSJ89097.1 hypothetical protein FG002_009495 [Chitinimonas sp. BJB300]
MLASTQSELEQIRIDCQALVRKRARLSAGAAIIPVPGMDMLTDVMVFSELLETISARFGLSHTQLAELDPASRQYLLLLAGRVGSDFIGRLISRQLLSLVLRKLGTRMLGKTVIRFVPLAGQAVAATLSYRMVARLGDNHIDDCYRVALAHTEQAKDLATIDAKVTRIRRKAEPK